MCGSEAGSCAEDTGDARFDKSRPGPLRDRFDPPIALERDAIDGCRIHPDRKTRGWVNFLSRFLAFGGTIVMHVPTPLRCRIDIFSPLPWSHHGSGQGYAAI